MKPRCPSGSRRCNNGKCMKRITSTKQTKRCRKGMRKCVDKKCYRKSGTNSPVRRSYTLRNRTIA